ncbi:hypothetical protein BGX28_008715 [Mortierella sp. GBA30]|nr:hypothetical protein BGX28_008715 [Mortierella sp. GBA30]
MTYKNVVPKFAGCSWDRFWYIVDEFLQKAQTGKEQAESERDASMMKRTDEKFRQFFWNNFVQEDGVLFYLHNARTGTSVGMQQDHSKASFVPPSEMTPVENTEPTYQEVTETYKDSLRIVANAERQKQAILGNSIVSLPKGNQAVQILQSITATRQYGATQAQLAKQHEVDPRSMFHFLKVLIDLKLIVKIPVTTGGQYTLLCLHSRFAPLNAGYIAMNSDSNFTSAGRAIVTSDDGKRFEGLVKSDAKKVSYYSGLIKQKLTDILGRSKTQVMTIEDLAKALDLSDMNTVQNRWFNRQIELLCKLKYIKRVAVTGQYRCVQLLRRFGQELQEDGKYKREEMNLNVKSIIAEDAPQSGICIDTSIEHQVYKLIVGSKEQGTIAKEIRRNLNMLNVRLLARILDTLCKPISGADKPLARRVVEFVGRERRYRYYSEESFNNGVAQDHKEYIAKARVSSKATSSQKKDFAPTLDDTLQPDAQSMSSNAQNPTEESTSSASSGTAATEIQAAENPPIVSGPAQAGTAERYISTTLVKRRKILLSIMDRKKMVEIHATLVAEYQNEKKLLYPDDTETSVIDRKTLYRTLNILETEGLVKIFQVQNLPTVGSGTATKTFCLHPTVEPDSKEVKAFVKECSDRQVLFGSLAQKPMQRAEKLDIEVETLDQMQQRLGDGLFKGPAIPFSDIGAVKPKDSRTEARKKHNRGCDFEGSEYAVEFGWYKAKMMRALVFHRFLLDRLTSEDRRLFTFEGHPNVISTSPLFELLALRVYLIVVGILREPSPENREYLDVHRESNVPLNDLPDHMKTLVAPNLNFKKRLREVLEILDALGLVTPLENAPSLGSDPTGLKYAKNHLVLHTYYEVHLNVKAPLDPVVPEKLDHDLENRQQYNFTSARECREFWMDLQASSSLMKAMDTDPTKNTARPWGEIRRDFLLNLCNKRIWADPIRITESQRMALMKYVNESTRFAPNVQDPRLAKIAKEAGIPRNHAVGFYNAIRVAWYNNPSTTRANRQQKKVTRLSQVQSNRAKQREVSLQPKIDYAAESSTPSDTAKSAPDNGSQNDVSEQTAHGDYAVGKPKKTRIRRILWTEDEDDRMLLALAIIRYISQTRLTRFSWNGVAKALHGTRKPEMCRHRVEKLMRETTMSKRLESYRVQFSLVFPEISKKFPIDQNLQQFDPCAIMEYFRPRYDRADGTSATHSTLLPNNADDIEKLYHVNHSEPLSCLYVEDKLIYEMSMPRRLALFTQLPSTLRACGLTELDCWPQELSAPYPVGGATSVMTRDEVHGQELIILSVIKAIYSMPYQKFTRELSRVILGTFAASTIQDACSLAKSWKVLRLIRRASHRIPGQNLARSERFSNVMAGAFPRAMTAAAARLHAELKVTPEQVFIPEVGPAAMLVFFNNLAMGWVQLCMKQSNEADREEALVDTFGQGVLVHFDVLMNTHIVPEARARPTPAIKSLKRSGEDAEEEADQDSVEESLMKRAKIQSKSIGRTAGDPWQDTLDRVEVDFKAYLETIPNADRRRLHENVYDVVGSSAASGMVLQDIKNTLLNLGVGAPSDKDIVDCVDTLQKRMPPVLLKVGMAHPRYVVFGYHGNWSVNYAAAVTQVRYIEQHTTETDLAFDPMNWIVPRMWRTLEGKFDKATYEKSLHAVLTHIVMKPGCSKGDLLRYFDKVILPVELDDLLDELERRKAITMEYVIQPKPVSLFSKKGSFIACDRYTIDERKITNYFPQPAYYSFLDMTAALSSKRGATTVLPGEEDAVGDEEDSEEGEDDEDEQDEVDLVDEKEQVIVSVSALTVLVLRKPALAPFRSCSRPPDAAAQERECASSTPYDPHPGPSSKTAQLQQQVNDVVGIMQQNIDSVRDRGEKLDSLQHKTTDLEQGAVQFRKGASGVRRQMWWKNMKWRLIVGVGIILLLVIIIVPIVNSTKK